MHGKPSQRLDVTRRRDGSPPPDAHRQQKERIVSDDRPRFDPETLSSPIRVERQKDRPERPRVDAHAGSNTEADAARARGTDAGPDVDPEGDLRHPGPEATFDIPGPRLDGINQRNGAEVERREHELTGFRRPPIRSRPSHDLSTDQHAAVKRAARAQVPASLGSRSRVGSTEQVPARPEPHFNPQAVAVRLRERAAREGHERGADQDAESGVLYYRLLGFMARPPSLGMVPADRIGRSSSLNGANDP